MANQELLNKTYQIPQNVLKSIQATLISNPNGEGIKRAKFLIKNGVVTYQVLKRLKNFFDYFNPEIDDKVQYALAGGDLMKHFIEQSLATDRDTVNRSKNTKRDMNVDINSGLKISRDAPELNEDKKENNDKLNKNAIAVIINDDNKILLLKRAKVKGGWGNNQWSLVGGGIEKDETPQQAVKREIEEETGLEIKNFIKSFSIQRNIDSIEHVFACRYSGEPTEIKLNEENTNYGWYDASEIKFLNTVPHLIEYITLIFKKYE